MLRFFILIVFIFIPSLRAEYRVFELEITSYAPAAPEAVKNSPAQPPEEIGKRVVLSTLDPQQYRGYYTVQPNEQIRYIATWKCSGRTASKDYCPNPKVKTDGADVSVSLESK